ncbi:uncharacterized protein LOC129579310 [Sitodiplosis mosellana]|uniref:uncharacterized protein LOC129579310 n=1 Tax=Sitodiplosis mosellana TaxID=263140 RepID=UPI002443ACD1|nr:uncharacterized protein LOC129579310 [Sitodiplosis mosellana]XP_055325241.1 uncharacterized protein LOC129579310 [Sitodiplosis mosellana]XP_055325242.1 uncharacterized protein LOC129579310 [Sitodiplosis mosellana]XP_055325243.1 uncharacterized protein LOC129579310 [Sitodiplosis mosellana]XP_055325244.1 uncharacterized protein LOC129579310 [Sitodiplosis mosellana]
MEPALVPYFRYINNRSFDEIPSATVPIRTLYIASTEPIEYGDIYGFFNQFDEIEFVYWHELNQAQHGFVQFRTSNGAEAALQHPEYRFRTIVLRVMAGKPWHQPDFPPELKSNLTNCADYMQNTRNHCSVPIRTLFIASDEPITIPQFRDHFEQFGGVECFRWHSINSFNYGFVQFIDAESAKNALLQPVQLCGNAILTVAEAHEHFKPGSTNINMLNDDCLKHVFGHLNITNLAIAIDVCTRFQQQVQETFSLVESVSVHNQSIVNLVTRYCVATRLKDLVLNNITFNKELMQSLQPLLKKLKKLHLTDCEFGDGTADTLPTTMELNDLRIFDSFGKNRAEITDSLLKLNTHLRKVALRNCGDESPIHENSEHLIELESNIRYYLSIGKLSSLKVLILDLFSMSLLRFLQKTVQNSSSVQHLELIYVDFRNDDNFIGPPMRQLKVLKLTTPQGFDQHHLLFLPTVFPALHKLCVDYFAMPLLTSYTLRELLSQANQLSILELFCSENIEIFITNDGYDEMLSVVRNRNGNNSVLIDIKCRQCHGYYPKEGSIKNPHYLNIKVNENY